MNTLIKVSTNEQGNRVVSARDLHSFLGNKKQFADWIKNRIEKYGFVENQDYTTFSLIGEKGRPTLEYALTIECAKEIAMVEANKRGKEARQYFIECEKVAHQVISPTQAQESLLLPFTERPKQIQNSKDVNSYNFSHGGKEQAIAYNRMNCMLHTGKTPSELVEWAKKKNVPSKFRTSAKEVIRTFKPAVGASMALADDFCKTGKIGIEQSAVLCKTHALPIFEKMQEFGILKAPDIPMRLKQG